MGSSVPKRKTIDVSIPNSSSTQMTRKLTRGSTYNFNLLTDANDTPKYFEWHQKSGKEVEYLNGQGSGWELVRMHNPHSNKEDVIIT